MCNSHHPLLEMHYFEKMKVEKERKINKIIFSFHNSTKNDLIPISYFICIFAVIKLL